MGRRVSGCSGRVGRSSIPEVSYIRCLICSWTTEFRGVRVGKLLVDRPEVCGRCKWADITRITKDEFLRLLDRHEVEYCESCMVIHSGDVLPQ